jgi:hypothetical protein
MEERRRSVRVAVEHSSVANLPTAQSVQVLDISLVGVLLHANRRMDPGTRGCLRLNLWGASFAADIEVRRVAPIMDNGRHEGYRVGATFVAISAEHRQLIERFAIQ